MNIKKILCGVTLASTLTTEVCSVTSSSCFASLFAKSFANIEEHDVVPCIPKAALGIAALSVLKKKQQIDDGPCWAFATIAALETFMYKKGLLKDSLSEKHLIEWANRKDREDGWHISCFYDGASNYDASKGYLLSGEGSVKEKDKKYNLEDKYFSNKDKEITPVCSVKGIEELSTDINSVKAAIKKYGAVCAQYRV